VPAARDPSEHVFELTGCFGVRLDESRKTELQAFYEGCRDYFELVTGQPPGPNEARPPPRRAAREDARRQFVIGLFDAPGHLVGVLDVIRDFPKASEWYLGLLLFEPRLRGTGSATASTTGSRTGSAHRAAPRSTSSSRR
jgi:hypothetical protein